MGALREGKGRGRESATPDHLHRGTERLTEEEGRTHVTDRMVPVTAGAGLAGVVAVVRAGAIATRHGSLAGRGR
jgi:hypothetical protein